MKIVIDNKIPFIRGVFEPYADVVYLPGKDTTAGVVRDADAIVTRTRTICDRALLEGSSVKAIATATIGFDHIDTEWCESAGIAWSNAPGCNSWSVKQYISSVLSVLSLRHHLSLEGMTLGVVGVGNVGSKVAQAGRALGMRVLLNDPPRARREDPSPFTSLDRLLHESDIVTVHVPLTRDGADATWHLFDAGCLGSMRPDQILINSSRGPVVDNQALKAVLKAGGLKAAVLDVWEGEPDLDPEIVDLLDLATPHIAGYSADGKANGTTMSVRYIAGQLGLPLGDWTASGVPAPEQPLDFALDATGRTRQEVLVEAILHAYDVRRDSDALRAGTGAFERLRGDYQVRREPSAFRLTVTGADRDTVSVLKLLDFNVIEN